MQVSGRGMRSEVGGGVRLEDKAAAHVVTP